MTFYRFYVIFNTVAWAAMVVLAWKRCQADKQPTYKPFDGETDSELAQWDAYARTLPPGTQLTTAHMNVFAAIVSAARLGHPVANNENSEVFRLVMGSKKAAS